MLVLVRRVVRQTFLMMILFAALVAGTGWWFSRLPKGFMPLEDQGYAIVGVQLPDASSQVRTRAVVDKLSKILAKTPGIANWFLIGGNSILDQAAASNAAAFYITFTPWSERNGKPGLSQEEILKTLMESVQPIPRSH